MIQQFTRPWGSFIGTENTFYAEIRTRHMFMPFMWLYSRGYLPGHKKGKQVEFYSGMDCFRNVSTGNVYELDGLGNLVLINVVGSAPDKNVRWQSRRPFYRVIRDLVQRRNSEILRKTLNADGVEYSCIQIGPEHWIGTRMDHVINVAGKLFTMRELELAVEDGLIKPIKAA
jgi:hypothetical protein